MPDHSTEITTVKDELMQILTLMAVQLALADRIVADHLPKAEELLRNLQVISSEMGDMWVE